MENMEHGSGADKTMRKPSKFSMSSKVFAMTSMVMLASVGASPSQPSQQQKPPTVIVLDLAGDGIAFSSVENGVEFSLEAPGQVQRTAWTRQGSDDGFLALDFNGNGVIDDARELVGNRLVLEKNGPINLGVNALQFPLQGYPLGPDSKPVGGVPRPLPFGFGVIDQSDAAFKTLRVWIDANHDGKTGSGELRTLAESKVERIDLTFRIYDSIETAPKDEFGNRRYVLGKFQRYKEGLLTPHEFVEVALAK